MPRRPRRDRDFAFMLPEEPDARPSEDVVRWMLRLVVSAGAEKLLLDSDGDATSRLRGLFRWLAIKRPSADKKLTAAAIEATLRRQLAKLERKALGHTHGHARRNAVLLGGLLGLSAVEVEVLAFIIALNCEEPLSDMMQRLGGTSPARLRKHIATATGLPLREVERAFDADGTLRATPLVTVTRRDFRQQNAVDIASWLEGPLMRPLEGERDLLRHFVTSAPAAELTLDDYPHLAREVELLTGFLRGALAERRRGANVLLYGPPGTGKTKLAHALAAALGVELLEVNLEDEDHDAHPGPARLGAYALSQRLTKGRERTLILFDEAEDVFPMHSRFVQAMSGTTPLTKAWINRQLESNPIPTLWISNQLDMDRAYVRRFDLVIELGQPGRTARRRVLGKHLQGLSLSESLIDSLAELEHLTPSHVERAATVVKLTRPVDAAQAEARLRQVLHHNLRAYAGTTTPRPRSRCEVPYDLGLANADTDLSALVAGLQMGRRGTLCLYGPPGTGKTEFARHVARALELPVAEHRASDLLDCYLGETEKRMAAMFEGAAREGALLLLDEADSFLSDRRSAMRSWEITQVNEMLTQMEQFDGLFVCCTNLIDHLDRAALRRFALKVKLDYLRPEQTERLFRATLGAVSGGTQERVPAGVLAELSRLRTLTPGDFAAATRRARVLGGTLEPEALLDVLRQECGLKRDGVGTSKVVGFG